MSQAIILYPPYYVPTNHASLYSLFLYLLIMIPISGSLSIIYLSFNRMSTDARMNIAILALLTGCIYGLSYLLIRFLKLHSPQKMLITGIIFFFVFTYIKWLFHISFITAWYKREVNYSDFGLSAYFEYFMFYLRSPVDFVSMILGINKVGTWTFGADASTASPVNGILLTLFWLIELGIGALFFIYLPRQQTLEPFIESDNAWAIHEKKKPIILQHFSLIGQKLAIEQDPSILLEKNVQFAQTGSMFVRLDFYHSKDYSECYISLREFKRNQKGQYTGTANKLQFLRVPSDLISNLYAKAQNI